MEFAIGDHIFLKVIPYKRKIQFRKRGKFNPHYVGPFKIIESVGQLIVSHYPQNFMAFTMFFHVSVLKKHHPYPSQIIPYQKIIVDLGMTYTEYPTEIANIMEKVLHNKRIPIVKVLWEQHAPKEAM